MRPLLHASALIGIVLLVVVIPFLVLGESFERAVLDWFRPTRSPAVLSLLIAVALASDIFLPIPSSAVSTYGGGVLGMWPATGVSWLGMTVGAVLGFALARLLGKPFAERFAASEDLQRMIVFTRRFGPLALVLTRALPILAEACVLLVGATRLSWKRFLLPVVVCNLLISLAYAACGAYFGGRGALPLAVVASGAVPLAVALVVRQWIPVWGLDEPGDAPVDADGNP